jgi:hypothetical protein
VRGGVRIAAESRKGGLERLSRRGSQSTSEQSNTKLDRAEPKILEMAIYLIYLWPKISGKSDLV